MKTPRLFACVVMLSAMGNHALACDCSQQPIITESTILLESNRNLVAARIIGYIDDDMRQIPLLMEIEITRIFRGEPSSNTVIVRGDGGSDCLPYVTHFPIDTEWLIGFSQSENSDTATLASCNWGVEIVDGQVEGFVRNRPCDDADLACRNNYEPFIEKFTIDEFDQLQNAYSQGFGGLLQDSYSKGVEEGKATCEQSYSSDCYPSASYNIETQQLELQTVNVLANDEPVGQVGLTLKKLSSGKEILFELTEFYFIETQSGGSSGNK